MEISLERDGAPVYRQIVEQIRHQVATGELAQGERLPTVRQLAQDLNVDRNTALRAYRVPQRDGVISLQHGRGTFVRTDPRHPHLTRYRQTALDNMLDENIARVLALGYAPDEVERAFQKRLAHWQRVRVRAAPRRED